MIIYAITCAVTGKRYIGMTEMTPGRRWWHHVFTARRGTKTALSNAIRLYGEDAFQIEVIASLMPGMGREQLQELERFVIAQEGTLAPAGYNMTPGGDGIPKGYKHARPSKLRGRMLSAETRAKMSASRVGKPSTMTPDSAAKIAATLRGRKQEKTPARLAAVEARRGQQWSQERREKQAAYWSAERRESWGRYMAARSFAADNRRSA